MMNKIIIFFFGMLTLTSFGQVDSYIYKRPLDKTSTEGYFAIPLIPEVVARTKSELADIRLFNINGNDTTEVPYILNKLGGSVKETELPFQLINDTYNQKCCSYVTLKFNKKQTINSIRLSVSESNFDKALKIEGSNDGNEWFTIRDHMRIVRFQNANADFSYTTLDFKDSEYNYFRLKLDDDGSPRITVTGASAFQNSLIPGSYDELKVKSLKQTENKKEKTSEVIVDLPFSYVISHFTIKTAPGKDFYRNMNVYGSTGTFKTSKGEFENWSLINTSVLASDQDNSISCNDFKTNRLKIEIVNYDNAPVEITAVKAYSERLQLEAPLPPAGVTFLAYGKANDAAPNYDLVHFRDKIPNSLSIVNYGEEQELTSSVVKASPLIESKNWLWLAMGIVILIIGYFALSMVKKENGSDN